MALEITIQADDLQEQYATYAWQYAVANGETTTKDVNAYLHDIYQKNFDSAVDSWADYIVAQQLKPIADEIKKDPSKMQDVTSAVGIEAIQPIEKV